MLTHVDLFPHESDRVQPDIRYSIIIVPLHSGFWPFIMLCFAIVGTISGAGLPLLEGENSRRSNDQVAIGTNLGPQCSS
jgi:hypothetical protein